jgi:hypothetical protein
MRRLALDRRGHGRRVVLTTDPTQATFDRYGRPLAYVRTTTGNQLNVAQVVVGRREFMTAGPPGSAGRQPPSVVPHHDGSLWNTLGPYGWLQPAPVDAIPQLRDPHRAHVTREPSGRYTLRGSVRTPGLLARAEYTLYICDGCGSYSYAWLPEGCRPLQPAVPRQARRGSDQLGRPRPEEQANSRAAPDHGVG